MNLYRSSPQRPTAQPLRSCGLMTNPNLSGGRSRRRWVLTVLFIPLLTVSMMGPTQALSGVMTASVAVMETFSALVGPDTATPKAPASTRSRPQWVDDFLTPDFTKLSLGADPASSDVGTVGSGASEADAIAGASSAAASQGQGGAGSVGASGWPGYGGGAVGAGGGGSGLGLGGGGGAPIESLAATDQGLAQELALLDVSAGPPTFALDPGIAGDGFVPGGFGGSVPPGGSAADTPPGGSVPGSPAGPGAGELPGGSAGNGPTLGDSLTPQPPASGPSSSGNPPFPPTPFADGGPPPPIIKDLLGDPGAESPDLPEASGTAPGGIGIGFRLTEVPEPSTLVLISLGLAALRSRSRQDKSSRRS